MQVANHLISKSPPEALLIACADQRLTTSSLKIARSFLAHATRQRNTWEWHTSEVLNHEFRPVGLVPIFGKREESCNELCSVGLVPTFGKREKLRYYSNLILGLPDLTTTSTWLWFSISIPFCEENNCSNSFPVCGCFGFSPIAIDL